MNKIQMRDNSGYTETDFWSEYIVVGFAFTWKTLAIDEYLSPNVFFLVINYSRLTARIYFRPILTEYRKMALAVI